jgi:hypothetical protein
MPASVHQRSQLGDAHNFGRRVRLGRGRVTKPRTLLWEWLLLCAESPLRRRLDELGAREGIEHEAFGFLPDLRFSAPHAREGGEVDRVELAPLSARSARSKRALAEIVGRALALFSWLGLSDLHWENLVLGVDARGRVIFAPLDVEMILADLSLPTETKLLPDADPEVAEVCRHACGVRRALPWLGKPVPAELLVAMAGAYRGTLEILDRHAPAIAEVFAALPGLRETPIRVLLRGTDAYVHAATAPPWPPLLDAEAEQLARGDIPYFFRLYGRAGIHYWADEALTRAERLPTRGDVPQLEPLLRVSRDLRSPSRRRLREDGLFTVLGAFDHASLRGHQAGESLAVRFAPRTLKVTLSDGEELETRRDTSAFVGSVYLPCRCGEVRTVFVPAVTRCVARPARR